MRAYILAVDDDPEVLDTLGRVLERENFEHDLTSSGLMALQSIRKRRPDLIILDIIMPGMDGIAVCEHIRRDQQLINLPILFLTAKGSTDDIVGGLDAGADDYVIKPFDLTELRARIRALLRRGMRRRPDEVPVLEFNDLSLNSGTQQVTIRGITIQLTATEHRLLRYMLEHIDRAVSLSQLLQDVWEYPPDTGDPDLVRAHIRNLRAKIEKNNGYKLIRTIHGRGYMIASTDAT